MDVYNWVSQALASAEVVSGDAGTTAIKFRLKSAGQYYYCTPTQYARLQRIAAKAAAIVDAGGQ